MNQFQLWSEQSETMRACSLGQISPEAARFWPKLGVSIVENIVVGLKCHVWLPSKALKSLLVNQFWLWNASTTVYNYAHMWFGPEHPPNCPFLANFRGRLGTKWCVWMKNPCTIPIPGLINLSHEPILTLECLCSNLQPFAHVIWAKSALELLVFSQNWESPWQKLLWLA